MSVAPVKSVFKLSQKGAFPWGGSYEVIAEVKSHGNKLPAGRQSSMTVSKAFCSFQLKEGGFHMKRTHKSDLNLQCLKCWRHTNGHGTVAGVSGTFAWQCLQCFTWLHAARLCVPCLNEMKLPLSESWADCRRTPHLTFLLQMEGDEQFDIYAFSV